MFKRFTLVAFLIIFILGGIITFRALHLQPNINHSTAPVKFAQVDRQAITTHFSKALQFQTISTHDKNKENATSFEGFHKFLRETYPTVFAKLEVQPFPPYALALKWTGKQPEKKPYLFMAHQDVVPIAPGTLTQWTHPPFSGDIDQGAVWGRGAMDDKASLIAIFEAVNHLLSEGYQPDRTYYFFFGDQEEISGPSTVDAAQYFQDHNIQFEAVVDEGGSVMTGVYTQVSDPVAPIGVSEKGYLDVELSNQSVGGHSSIPPVQTSIGILSAAITKLEQHPFPNHYSGLQRHLLETLARYMRFDDRVLYANAWLFKPVIEMTLAKSPFTHALISTTSAATIFQSGVQANVLPAEAKAVVNIRILPGETVESSVERVKSTIDDPRVSVNVIKSFNPQAISSHDTEMYRNIHDLVQELYPKDAVIITPGFLFGATDSRHFSKVTDNIYRFLPYKVTKEDLSGFHGINEHLSIDNLERCVQYYIALMKH